MTKLDIEKDEFMEFLQQAAEVRSLTFSTNHSGSVFPCDKFGFHHESERRYIKRPSYLLRNSVAEYLTIRTIGGRFRIDFYGIYCHEVNRYVVRWNKSTDLVLYQTSTPKQSEDWIDIWRMMANREQEES